MKRLRKVSREKVDGDGFVSVIEKWEDVLSKEILVQEVRTSVCGKKNHSWNSWHYPRLDSGGTANASFWLRWIDHNLLKENERIR